MVIFSASRCIIEKNKSGFDGGNMDNKKVTGFDYLWCALYAFASVAFELLVVVVEGVLGIDVNSNASVAIPCNCYLLCYQYYDVSVKSTIL